MLRRFLLTILLTVGVAGCANLQNAWNVITSTSVSPTVVVIAVNTFDALEVTGANYLRLPRCKAGGPIACRDPGVSEKIINAKVAGRKARNALEDFIRDHPGQLGPKGLYDALIKATATLQDIFAQYGIRSV